MKVVVFEVDEYKNRVSLITKVLESYPGEIIENITEVMSNAPERLERALLAAQEQERLQLQLQQEAEQAQEIEEIEEQVIAED